jgi:hypothetical protein
MTEPNMPMEPCPVPLEVLDARPQMATLIIGPPPGVPADECGSVHALAGMIGGYAAVTDYWRPTPEQLEALNAGGFIELVQYSSRMVMHSMSVWVAQEIAGPTE